MSKYSRYGYSASDWKRHHESKRAALTKFYGGIDKDILDVLYNLSSYDLDKFWFYYGKSYGDSAVRYGRKTYPEWKTGKRRPSADTLERMVQTLPSSLRFDDKFELLRRMRIRHRKLDSHKLSVTTNNWMQSIAPLVSDTIRKAYAQDLPEHIKQRLNWLSEGDVQAATTLLAAAEVREGQIAVKLLRQEFANIQKILSTVGERLVITHTIQLPYGSITLKIKRARPMSEKDNQIVSKQDRSLFKPTADDILDNAFANLDESAAKRINEQAASEALRLSVMSKENEMRFDNAQRELGSVADTVRMMENTTSADFSINKTIHSASGTTDIQVKRQPYRTTIIVALVVGVVLLLFYLTRH